MDPLNNSIFDLIQSCDTNGVRPTPFALVVVVSSQTVSLFENISRGPGHDMDDSRPRTGHYQFIRKYSCSTSRFGVGQKEGSNCTPLRLHRIAEKIGAGASAGTVFKGRRPIGHVSQPALADAKITTRILWLEGLEPGFNRGGNVDSHARYIYIHGTADQASIGKPASCGCVHLADDDLIPLFDLLPGGTLVWICE